MNFLWPAELNPDPGVIGRLGRVLHWVGVLFGLLVAGVVWFSFSQMDGTDLPPLAAGCVAAAAFFAMAGRGLRYIFAGE